MNTANGFGLPDAEVAKAAQKSPKKGQIPQSDCLREMNGAARQVQRVLNVGLLEIAFEAAMQIKLAGRELAFMREVLIKAAY